MKMVNLTPLMKKLEEIMDRELPDEQAHPLFDQVFDEFLSDYPGLPKSVLIIAVANAFRACAEQAAEQLSQRNQAHLN